MDYKQVKEFSVFESLSEDQVKTLIMKSLNKQCASDPIPTWMLKECLDDTAIPYSNRQFIITDWVLRECLERSTLISIIEKLYSGQNISEFPTNE